MRTETVNSVATRLSRTSSQRTTHATFQRGGDPAPGEHCQYFFTVSFDLNRKRKAASESARRYEAKCLNRWEVSQYQSREWEADLWLLVTPTMRQIVFKPHLRVRRLKLF